MQECDLERSQVVNWTTNVRKRNWKATVDKTKKPHNFIDFMFLALDRDERIAKPVQTEVEGDESAVDNNNDVDKNAVDNNNDIDKNAVDNNNDIDESAVNIDGNDDDDDENSTVTVKMVTGGKRTRLPRSQPSRTQTKRTAKKPKLPTRTRKKGHTNTKKGQDTKAKKSKSLDPLPIVAPTEIPQLEQFAAPKSPIYPDVSLSEGENNNDGSDTIPNQIKHCDDFNLHMLSLDQENDDFMPSLSDFFRKGLADERMMPGSCTGNGMTQNVNITLDTASHEDDFMMSVNPTMANLRQEMYDVDMLGLLDDGIDLAELKVGV